MSIDYSPDSPIESKKDDLFCRNVTAKALADALKSFDKKQSHIIGIYGPWGSGKTSTINLTKEYFENDNKYDFVCIDAWAHAGNITDIQIEIYNHLFSSSEKNTKKRRKNLLNFFKKAKTPKIDLSVKQIKLTSSEIIEAVKSVNDRRKIKDVILHATSEGDVKYIVCIDNMDRLCGKDIVELLEQLNRLSDIGGFTYLLPFDKDYVCKIISSVLPKNLNGEDYLDKMIHIPVSLPSLLREDLDKMFTDKLASLLNETKTKIDESEQTRFAALYYYHGLNKYVKTPRDIIRATNALKFSIASKKRTVNIVDFLTIELIKLFDKDFYNEIFINRNLLINNKDNSIYSTGDSEHEREENKKSAEALCEKSKIGSRVIEVLFPRLHGILHTTTTTMDEEQDRALKRISCPDYFNAYFSPSVSPSDIDDATITDLIICPTNKLSEFLKKSISATNYATAFRKIIDRKDEISDKLSFCKSLLDLSEIHGYNHGAAFTLSLYERALFAIDELLQDESNKLFLYESMLNYNFRLGRTKSIPFLLRQAILYSEPQNKPTDLILNRNELREYKKFALEIIRKMAKKDMIPWDTTESDSFIYSYWSQLGTKQEIDAYVKKHVKTADGAVDFITQFLGSWSALDEGFKYRGDFDGATLKAIDKYVEIKYLYDLISASSKYKKYIKSKLKDLKSFEEPFGNKEYREIGRVGNERSSEFRSIVAERFIYFYNNPEPNNDKNDSRNQ